MSQLPNYQARLARALRNNLSPESSVSVFHRFKWFTLAVAILIPIYPSLAALGQISEIQAGDYDPSSILFEYIDTGDLSPGYISDTGLVRVDLDTISGSHIAEPPPVEDAKPSDEPIPASTMRMYTVVEHDDIMKIAKNYQIDYEVILWMNDISLSDNLKEGQQLRIPSISGVIHTLRRGETVSDIAKTYNVPSSEILAANSITDPTRIRDGRKLLVPGATRPTPPPPPTPTQKLAPAPAPKPTTSATPVASTPAADTENYAAEIPIEYTPSEAIASAAAAANLKERYVVNYTGNGRWFVAGNCTWYVAQNKTVTWRGNANQWIKNAKAQGVPTGNIPVPGAIVQFSGRGYNSYYGHVGIVSEVHGDKLIVKDMNYSGLYKVTVREVSANDPAIDGYIYVD